MCNVNNAIEALKNGKMILLTDDKNRENEADLVFPAENITAEIMNFMIRHGTGIVCVSLLEEHLQKLQLPLMVSEKENSSQHHTPFTIPVDAREDITTGVSAADRVKTIQVLLNEHSRAVDLVRPGHVYPLMAKAGGVLQRAGHTEGALDLIKLAGFKSAAVICELMNSDGTMTRGSELRVFAEQHQLPIVSIQELIHFRLSHENQICESASSEIILAEYGEFTIRILKEKYFAGEHITLYKKSYHKQNSLLVRMHSACATGDIFCSAQCDCHAQLHYALQKISEEGGLLIYLDQEGRGIGLLNKIKAYALQKQGRDTVEANLELGLPVDQRQYYIGAQILKNMACESIRLLTNNPQKISGLKEYGFLEVFREPMPVFIKPENQHYIYTKQQKMNHYQGDSSLRSE